MIDETEFLGPSWTFLGTRWWLAGILDIYDAGEIIIKECLRRLYATYSAIYLLMF